MQGLPSLRRRETGPHLVLSALSLPVAGGHRVESLRPVDGLSDAQLVPAQVRGAGAGRALPTPRRSTCTTVFDRGSCIAATGAGAGLMCTVRSGSRRRGSRSGPASAAGSSFLCKSRGFRHPSGGAATEPLLSLPSLTNEPCRARRRPAIKRASARSPPCDPPPRGGGS